MINGSGSPSRLVNPGGNTTSAPSLCCRSSVSASRSTRAVHQRLVHALAGDVVVGEQHAELAVHRVEVVVRHVDEAVPERERLRVAALQEHDPLAGPFLELGRFGELGVGLLVEAVEVALRQPVGGDVLTDVEQVLDEHAERPAPVADVVLADHVVTEERRASARARRRSRSSGDGRRASPWPRSAPSSRRRPSSA